MDDFSRNIAAMANALADAARAAILPVFRNLPEPADNKAQAGFDPVTVADRAAEKAMRALLEAQRPEDAIEGEEYGSTPGTSGVTWVLDPVDGTRAFLAGAPTWGVLIACVDANGPIYGVIDQPYIGERFEGGLGLARMRGPMGERELRVRESRPLSEALLFTTFPEIGTEAEAAGFRAVAGQAKLTRYGMDCYAYALLAAGQIDLVIEAGLHRYDIMAPIAVIEAAGGIVTDWRGGPVRAGGRVIAAAGAEQHRAALAILSQCE